ncbi:hypothetical protein [Pseudomonas sp. BGI-2]|uniref:hypothetical protein n=1 Tax=Pseudomonas sp. BGI-2 TaxID=2528211 RepID=UPI00103467B1|nr:hypothetical protein [Pseudomonas sp. BGI-2]TBN38248.1 hypothetical protein EYC95_22260 [Pseudomonas sp. BGI-2]
MNDLMINSNSNLVCNGDFSKGYECWKLANPSGVAIEGDTWEGKPIAVMRLTNGGKVFQPLKVPIDLNLPGARYHLRFLYENTFKTSPGTVIVGKTGSGGETLEIELPAIGSSADTEPAALILLDLERYLPLELAFNKDDEIEITLISPKKTPEDGAFAAIRLTRIELHVELEPLRLVKLFNEEREFDPGQVLPLCLGATGTKSHTLALTVAPDSPWNNTEAALWIEDNPLEAIITSPELGDNQRIDLPWRLDCPDLKLAEPSLFDLNFYSKYTAAPFPIRVSLGHHRLVMNVLKDATFFPVLEYGQSVPLEVQVLSFYTESPVPDQEVTWRWGEEILHSGKTDGEGKAGISWQPTVTHEGLQVITASVSSPYYTSGDQVQTFEIRVLKDDPWKAVQVRFEDMQAAVWGDKSGHPGRGGLYPFTLMFPEGSPFLGSQVALCWGEGHHLPGELEVSADPDFDEFVDIAGNECVWTLDCGDRRDAVFGLYLTSPMLLRSSRDNAMSLARNKLKIGEVREANKRPVVDEGDRVHCMLQVLTLNDEPALDVRVDWVRPGGITTTTYTGTGGWASEFDIPTDAAAYGIEAQVWIREEIAPLKYLFQVEPLATSQWANDIVFSFDGGPIVRDERSMMCTVGANHLFRIEAREGSSFIGRRISINLRSETSGLLKFDPPLPYSELLTQEGQEFQITSDVGTSGLFELEIASEFLAEKRELSGRLIGARLEHEMEFVFDSRTSPLGEKSYPCIGAKHQVTLRPHAFSGAMGLRLHSTPLSSPVIVTPGMRTAQRITAGGVRYQIECPADVGAADFGIAFHTYYGGLLPIWDRSFKLDHNKLKVGAVRKAAVDPVLSKGERARLEIQYLSVFTNMPANGMKVQWGTPPIFSVTDDNGWAINDCKPESAGPNHVPVWFENPYDGSRTEESFEVVALEDDPWEKLWVETEDEPSHLWAAKTMFPRRGHEFSFTVSANDGNYLHGQDLALGCTGTSPNGLGLSIGPVPFGQWRPFLDALPFTLNADGEKDGSVYFQLAASRLLELSPPTAVSLGTASKAVKLSGPAGLLNVVDWGSKITAQVKAVSTLSGKAIAGLDVVWEGMGLEHVSTKTNFYGDATISFTPTEVGLGQLTATVGDQDYSESILLPFFLNDPREILSLSSPDPAGFPGEVVSANAIVVSAITGTPLSDVEVMWGFPGVTIAPTRTDKEGKATVMFRLSADQPSVLGASVRGGMAGWDSALLLFTVEDRELAIVDLSGNGEYKVGETARLYFRLVVNSTGEGVEGVNVAFTKNGVPDGIVRSSERGIVRKSYQADRFGHFEIRMRVENTDGTVNVEQRAGISFVDP